MTSLKKVKTETFITIKIVKIGLFQNIVLYFDLKCYTYIKL